MCPKCKGLIVKDVVLSKSYYWMDILRCVNCGLVKPCNSEAEAYEKARRADKLDELELCRAGGGSVKRDSNII